MNTRLVMTRKGVGNATVQVVLASIALALAHAALAQDGDVFDQFSRYVETENRTFQQGMPGETVDPFTGNVRIVNTDVVLPGMGGHDLRIVRSYSSKIWGRTDQAESLLAPKERSVLGWGWTFHMGRIKNPNASGQPTGPCSGDYPILEMPDGSTRVFYRVAMLDVWWSRDYWRMEKNCSMLGGAGTCVWSTDGTRYEFSAGGGNWNYYYYGGTTLVWPATRIVDRFGNRIAVTYTQDQTGAIDRITDTYGRQIQFGYSPEAQGGEDNKKLITMTVNGSVYRYNYTWYATPVGYRRFLTEVVPPVGRSFKYTYVDTTPSQNQYALESITYTYGGTVTYQYASQIFWEGIGSAVPFAVVWTRTVGGLGVVGGTWTYTYNAPEAGMNTTTVTRPGGRGATTSDVYSMYGFGAVSTGSLWKVGLTKEISKAGGAEVETMTWVPSAVPVANALFSVPGYDYVLCTDATSYPPLDYQVYAPVLGQRNVRRDGTEFTITYSNWDAYGQAQTVSETGPDGQGGPVNRTTTLTYAYSPTDTFGATLNLVRGRPLTKAVCVGSSDCFTDSWTYRPSADSDGPAFSKKTETRSGVTTTFAYHTGSTEGVGNLWKVTNALGQTLTLTGYVAGYGTPLNVDFNGAFTHVRTTTWDGWTLTDKDGRNNTTTFTYDAIGRTKTVTPPGTSEVTTYVYDTVGSGGVSVDKKRGSSYTLTTTYDGFGRPTATSDTVGVKTSRKYDALGQLWFRSFPYDTAEVGEKLDLDALGRVTTLWKACKGASSPTTSCTSTAYLSTVTNAYQSGNCVQTTEQRNPDSVVTTRCYASFGDPGEQRLTYVQDGAGSDWKYTYTAAGDLHTVTAPSAAGGRTYEHDGNQFLTGELAGELGKISGDTVSLRYTPNAIGQVKTRKDARSVTWTYDYTDPLSRLKGITYGSSSGDDVSRTYQTGSNNLSTVSTTNGGSYSFSTYDEVNRLRYQAWAFRGSSYTTTYDYDVYGCLHQIGYPTNSVVTQTCDAANRVTSISLNGAMVASSITYDPSGQPNAMTYANGKTVSVHYDDRARAETITSSGVVNLVYTYDGLDNVTTLDNTVVSGSSRRMCSTASGTCSGGYDELNRLITVIAPNQWGTAVYDYDPLGNRNLNSVGSTTATYTYDPASNRIATASGVALPTMTFTWDLAGRLATSSDNASYVYDGLARRVQKTTPSGTTVYHYDGAGRVIAETTPTGSKLRDYIYLAGKLVVVDGCVTTGATTCKERQWYHTDPLGSVWARSDATNVYRFDYQAWGETWTSPAGAEGDRQYNGRVYDAGTGFHDYGARMYWPQIGRFVSADTYQGDIASPASQNRYSYVNNNPYGLVDPRGHTPAIPLLLARFIAIGDAIAGGAVWVAEGALSASAGAGAGLLMVPSPTATGDDAYLGNFTYSASGVSTSNAARREAMRQQGIPTSQQPASQSQDESGRVYEYLVPGPGGGTQEMSVQQQTMDRSHPGEEHWEAGKVKKDSEGNVRTNNYGRPKLQNDKSKVEVEKK